MSLFLYAAVLLAQANSGTAGAAPAVAAAPQGGNVRLNGFFSVDPAKQGSSFQAAIVMEIPDGLHVNSNRPLGKYAIPTTVKLEASHGLKVSAVSFPQGKVRSFKFGEGAPAERLAVYEGRAIMRFNVTVPANAEKGVAQVRARVRYQSCNDEVCFPPATRDLPLAIAIVGPEGQIQRINGQYFGGGRRR